MTKRKQRTAALVIRDASAFTLHGRRKIAAWLRAQADHLTKQGDNYARRFTAGLTLSR